MSDLNELAVFAAASGNFDKLKQRVEAGADLGFIHPTKGSALYASIKNAHALAYLLEKGADPNLVMEFNGWTALDHALSMTDYCTGQASYVLQQHGATSNEWKILPSPSEKQFLSVELMLHAASWFKAISCGQVIFGRLSCTDEEWRASMNLGYKSKEGHLFRIEAMYLNDITSIHWLGYDNSYEVTFYDYRGRPHKYRDGDFDEITLQGTVEILRPKNQ